MAKRKLSDVDGADSTSITNGTKHRKLDQDSKEKLINDANAMSSSDFKKRYVRDEMLQFSAETGTIDRRIEISFKPSTQLTEDEFHACFNLVQSTSRHDYEASSWGWHAKRKKREMRDEDMRYLLIQSPESNDRATSATHTLIQGFLSFMLTHDSTPSVPVLYVYEVHLAESLRKLGLGARLMDCAEAIAEKVGVEKVMLTCFLSNQRALGFYKRRGYVTDPISPADRRTRNKIIKVDYCIMSKIVSKMRRGFHRENGDEQRP